MIRCRNIKSTRFMTMVNSSDWVKRDLARVWHPCSQMKDYEKFQPVEISKAKGCYIYDQNGNKILDAISSWWSKSLGHQHPKVLEAVNQQLKQYEHVIGTNTCQKPLVELSEKICEIIPQSEKVFYSGDGSCAVEIAMKMSLHAKQLLGEKKRTQFLSLCNGYHGETALTLSVSDLGLYKAPYQSALHDFPLIEPIYVNGSADPLWHDCSELWAAVQAELDQYKETLAAIVFEPILQGAGHMKMMSADFLNRLCKWAKQNNIYTIADEIMTGIGRTGTWLASTHANIQADFVCLSKGLTSGFCAFSAVATTDEIYQIFYHDYDKDHNFLHSQTYSGNALGAAAGLATLRTMESENIIQNVEIIETFMWREMKKLESEGLVHNIRGIGGAIAADLVNDSKRLGFATFQHALKKGLFLRPLGNTIYWLPPLIIQEQEIRYMAEKTVDAIIAAQTDHP